MTSVVTPVKLAAASGVSIKLAASQASHQARSELDPLRSTTSVSLSIVTSVRFQLLVMMRPARYEKFARRHGHVLECDRPRDQATAQMICPGSPASADDRIPWTIMSSRNRY